MRVTNQMVTSSSLRNMQKTMQRVSALNEQSTTGKKISAPSDDPVIAIRALKLRTTCAKLTQYKEKNIPDALSWLKTTESSIQNVIDRLEDVYYYATQGAHDTFNTDDRSKIISELKSLKDAIYKEGGTTYAGRYLLSGYKTETNLVFQDVAAKTGLSYSIEENISPNSITAKNVVLNETVPGDLDDILKGNSAYNAPVSESVYRMKLAYGDLDSKDFSVIITDAGAKKNLTDLLGDPSKLKTMTTADSAAYYDVKDDEVHFIPETGELIFGKNIYNSIKAADNITVKYDKSQFEVGDLRPEMYFNCTQRKEMQDGSTATTNYTVSEEGQPIQYEVNFNQYLTVNAEGRDVITHDMGNKIMDMADAVQDVLDIENNIAKLKQMLSDPQYMNDEKAVAQINRMLEGADVELALKKENMQKLFGNNMTNFQNFESDVSAVQAKVGTNYSKLELIQKRVSEQLNNFDDLKSSNEDVEVEEVAIELYQSELAYNAALATTSSVIQKTLLDYL